MSAASIFKLVSNISKNNSKKIIEKLKGKPLSSSDQKTINSFLKQKDENLITNNELQAKVIDKFYPGGLKVLNKTDDLNEYNISFKLVGPKLQSPGERPFKLENREMVTIKAPSEEEAKAFIKQTKEYKRAFKNIKDNMPYSDESYHNPRLYINNIVKKKKGGSVMRDYYKNYNTQRTI
tara:strand:- start:152 stop:688 length:537 start_codon:yes stop_codon:yes gene_type:complete